MKSIYLLLIIMFTAISCGPSDKELEAQRIKENLRIIELHRQDSLQAIEVQKRLDYIKEEQEKVIGDIKFGMSEKQTKKLWKKFLKEHRKPSKFAVLKGSYDYYIGDYEFDDVSLDYGYWHPRYLNGSLYYFTMLGKSFSYEKYVAEAPKEFNAISNILENKFGKPDVDNGLIEWYKTDKNYFYTLKYWNIGKKRVEITLNPTRGTYYSVDVSIYIPEIVERLKRREELDAVNKAKKGKDSF